MGRNFLVREERSSTEAVSFFSVTPIFGYVHHGTAPLEQSSFSAGGDVISFLPHRR